MFPLSAFSGHAVNWLGGLGRQLTSTLAHTRFVPTWSNKASIGVNLVGFWTFGIKPQTTPRPPTTGQEFGWTGQHNLQGKPAGQ